MQMTQEQQAAVTARNPVLLVSAAAGSGKTAVLIRRVLDLIEKDDMSISRMLIVTFTRAAAGEMRQRLESALRERAEESPAFRRELGRVESAQISTIHVFCQRLVHEFFQTCDAPPEAQQLDEPTGARLMEQALSEAMDEAFENGGSDLSSLSNKYRDDQIVALVQKLYSFVIARPDPEKWLSDQSQRVFTADALENGEIANELLVQARLLLDGFAGLLDRARIMADDPVFPDKLRELYQMDRQTLDSLVSACAKGVKPLRAAIQAAAFAGQVRVSSKASEAEIAYKERFGTLRAAYKDLFKKLAALIPADLQNAKSDLEAMRPATRSLCSLCQGFMEKYAQKKRELGAIDFADLEHMSLHILREKELRTIISARFDAIFVDEYQDVSGIQESLLSALYQGVRSVFLVGDVKQSIYRFRQADPTLFMQKEADFSSLESAGERKIILNQNFRSREGVLSAVNTVFERVMRSDATEIEYDDMARLYAGTPSRNDPLTELHLFPALSRRSADQIAIEAREAARRIQALVGTPLRNRDGAEERLLSYRDFAILLPKSRNVADVVEKELTAEGVPVYTEDSGGSLGQTEITQTLSALCLADNRYDDLSLLSVLRGPVFGFTEGELASIRLTLDSRDQSFLNALSAKAEHTDELGRRCKAALNQLERERFLQSAMPLDEYLWDYLKRSGLYAFYGGMEGGKLRQANLRMLCYKAGEAVNQRGCDLHGFIEQVTGVSAAQDKTSPSILSPWEDVVRVMTMHKSKGLEFPIVILMGLSDRLSKEFGENSLQLHPRLGMALDYINDELRTTRPTMLGTLIKRVRVNEEKSERARLLYVAMTRAREQLIMMGHIRSGNLPDSWRMPNTAMRVSESSTMVDWLGQTACDEGWIQGETFSEAFSTFSTVSPQKTPHWEVVFHNELTEYPQKTSVRIAKQVSWQQGLIDQAHEIARLHEGKPASKAVVLPNADQQATPVVREPFKLGVTALVRRENELEILAEQTEETPVTKAKPIMPVRTSLLDEQPAAPECLAPSQKEATGADRGTATHHALALIPLKPLRACQTDAQRLDCVTQALDELQKAHILLKEQRKLIDDKLIANFYGSELGLRMLRSHTVKREWSFNYKDAALSSAVLQGVIDLCFLENEQWILIDYKTDHVDKAEALVPKYQKQLSIYARALTAVTGRSVASAALYSLRLGEAVYLDHDWSEKR